MPKAPITPITPEIEEDLVKNKRRDQAGDPNQSSDQEVPGSDEIPRSPTAAQRQPS